MKKTEAVRKNLGGKLPLGWAITTLGEIVQPSRAGEKIRRELLSCADVHTLLRLPTGIWYSAGVKANVLFFDRKPSKEKELWVYDLRTDKNFTLRQNPISSKDLNEFVGSYRPGSRNRRQESERFRRYSHADILADSKASLDLLWIGNDSYRDKNKFPSHDFLAAQVVALLKEAAQEFEAAVAPLKER
jgi:type I restriction enzyme M protein